MNFTWGKCTECGANVKIEINALLHEIKCKCEEVKEDKPKPRRRTRAVKDATETI